jgi:MFS family permease
LLSSLIVRSGVPVLSLLAGTGLLQVGIGLLFTALALRAGIAAFSTAATGLVMSAYFAGFVLGTYACPALIRHAGHVRAFAAMASIASTMPILHALVVHPVAWGVLRLVSGVCLVGLYMVIESWLNALAPNEQRGRIFASYMAVTLVAMAIGQFLILAGDTPGFLPFALTSVLLSFALVPITLTRVREPQAVQPPHFSLRTLYALSPLGVMGAIASGLLNGAFYSMGALFAQRVGFSATGIAAFMSATILGGALLQWPIGHYSDRRDRRAVTGGVCAISAGLAVLAFFAAHWSEPVLIAIGFLYGGFVFTLYGLSVAHVNDLVERTALLETSGGLLLLHGIGAAAGPAAAGVLMGALGPGSLMLYFAVVLTLTAAFAAWRLRVAPRSIPGGRHDYVPMVTSSQAALKLDPRVAHEHRE